MSINLKDPTIFYTSVLIGDAGIGGAPPAELTQVGGNPVAAALEVQSTLGAFLLPRLTDTQMNALTPVADGMIIYNITNAAVYERAAGAWTPVGSGGGGTITSITQGANIVLTPSPITTTGSVALNPVLTGLTSAVIGNISISVVSNHISSTGSLSLDSPSSISLNSNSGAGTIILNGLVSIPTGNTLSFANPANTFSTSLAAGAQGGNIHYTFPLSLPSINGQVLASTTTGTMSWVSQTAGTVTSITAGSNLTGGTITGSGTIALSNAVSGLTSLSVGNLTMSGTTIASGAALTISSLAAMDLSPTQLRINSETQVRSANALRWFNAGNTFSTSFTAPNLIANINYTLPLTAPTNGQVLSSTAGGVMSWITAGSGSVTSVSQGANIVCTPNPIVGTGTVALSTTLTGLTSAAIGNITISGDSISDLTIGNLTISSGALIVLNGTGTVSNTRLSIGANNGIQLFNPSNTFSTSIVPGNVSVDTIYTLPGGYPAVNGYVLSCTTAGTMSWIAQSGGVTTAKYLLQQADAGLPNAQSMGALATGIVKNTTTTGVQSIAVAGTDYYAPNAPTKIQDDNIQGNLFIGIAAAIGGSPSGSNNVGVGRLALNGITGSASNNTCFGYNAGSAITTQSDNTIVGVNASPNSAPTQCTYVGSNAGFSLSGTNSQNTFLGYNAGSSVTSATQCTLLGVSTSASNGIINGTAIGYGTFITASNSINLGNGCYVGINQASPAYTLHINAVSGAGYVFIANSGSGPSTPVGGGVLYVSNGALVYVGSNGTTTIVAPA